MNRVKVKIKVSDFFCLDTLLLGQGKLVFTQIYTILQLPKFLPFFPSHSSIPLQPFPTISHDGAHLPSIPCHQPPPTNLSLTPFKIPTDQATLTHSHFPPLSPHQQGMRISGGPVTEVVTVAEGSLGWSGRGERARLF